MKKRILGYIVTRDIGSGQGPEEMVLNTDLDCLKALFFAEKGDGATLFPTAAAAKAAIRHTAKVGVGTFYDAPYVISRVLA